MDPGFCLPKLNQHAVLSTSSHGACQLGFGTKGQSWMSSHNRSTTRFRHREHRVQLTVTQDTLSYRAPQTKGRNKQIQSTNGRDSYIVLFSLCLSIPLGFPPSFHLTLSFSAPHLLRRLSTRYRRYQLRMLVKNTIQFEVQLSFFGILVLETGCEYN